MGKGKITIKVETEEQPAPVKIEKIKKKHRKDKKKPRAPQPEALIETMYDDYQGVKKEQESENGNGYQQEPQQNRRINLQERVKLRHLAICFPDSVLEIPQTSALRAYFISEVARISSIFKVDEIVVLKDHGYTAKSQFFNPSEYVARNLQYLETPQYMRKNLFKMHADLKNAGLMNPIECHHHLKTTQLCEFREGVTLERPTKKNTGSWVDIGLKQQAQMDVLLTPNTRVTLRVKNFDEIEPTYYKAEAVSRRTPRLQKNLYWGYDVRIANNISEMIKGGDYDLKIVCNHHEDIVGIPQLFDFDSVNLEDKSVLIFFSGTDDLSKLIERDERAKLGIDEVIGLFDYSLQFRDFGVQKLRMEEQLFMGLQKMAKFVY